MERDVSINPSFCRRFHYSRAALVDHCNLVIHGSTHSARHPNNPIYAGLAQNVAALGLTDPGSLLGNVALLFKLLLKDPLGTLYWMTLGKFNIIFMANSDVGYGVIFTSVVKNITLYIGLAGCVRAFFTREYRWPTIVFLIYLLSSFLFVPTQRYALQYLPFLAIFTGYTSPSVSSRNHVRRMLLRRRKQQVRKWPRWTDDRLKQRQSER